MSYDVYLYHTDVRKSVEQGSQLENLEPVPIPKVEIDRLVERLGRYGYRVEFEAPDHRDFVREVAGCPIQVSVFSTEIGFSIPYWNNCDQAIIEARQDALELSDSDRLAFYDPQNDEWAP